MCISEEKSSVLVQRLLDFLEVFWGNFGGVNALNFTAKFSNFSGVSRCGKG